MLVACLERVCYQCGELQGVHCFCNYRVVLLLNCHLSIIKYGIFQGNTLSPLLFCLALSCLLDNLKRYKISVTVNLTHLMYIDDIKLFAQNDSLLWILLGHFLMTLAYRRLKLVWGSLLFSQFN